MTKMLQVLQKLIRRAGATVQQYEQSAVKVEYKDDRSPVTNADIASHEILVNGLSQFGYPILSEEGIDPPARFESNWLWLVDPLDGTKDFLEKTGEYSVMVGLLYKGKPVLGLVYQPVSDILYYAEKDSGAFLQEKNIAPIPIRVSNISEGAVMWVSRHHSRVKEQKLANALGIYQVRPAGSIGLKAALIARGSGELYVNSGDRCGEWDTGAAEIIVEEAGGRVTDLEGKRIEYNKRVPRNFTGVVMTNGKLHDAVIEKLQNM